MAPPLAAGLPAFKQIEPPPPSLVAQLHPLYPLPGLQDANPLWLLRISSFPQLPPVQHPDPPNYLQPPLQSIHLGAQDASPRW